MKRLLIPLLLLCAPCVEAQDIQKIPRLEQDVRQLQADLRVLTQQVGELRSRSERAVAQPPSLQSPTEAARKTDPGGAPSTPSAQWLDAGRWRQLRTGMSELEVVTVLGPPTAVRGQEAERVLRYALEIGSSGFLAGSVTMRNRAVVAVEIPTLR